MQKDGQVKEDEYKKLLQTPKEKRSYVIKEAEYVIKNYLEKIEDGQRVIARNKLKKKYNRLKNINLLLIAISILSTMLFILK